MKRLLISLALLGAFGCERDSVVASRNLSYEADNFKVFRRVIFYNAITDTYMLSIEGFCSINKDNADNQLEVTCRDNNMEFKKHFLGISDNTTYFVEQLDAKAVSTGRYKVVFKPSVIIPSIDFK